MLKIFRLTHLYVGMFIAPALLFFAFTGAVQSLGLHETNRDHPNYHPAKWIAVLAQLHKKQMTALPQRRGQAGPGNSPAPASGPLRPEQPRAADPQGTAEQTGSHKPHRQANEAAMAAPAGDPAAHLAAPAGPPGSPSAQAQTHDGGTQMGRRHNPWPLRGFFVLVSVGLFWSTVSGIYMSYKYNRSRLWVTVSLVAGVVVPLLLLIP